MGVLVQVLFWFD